MRLVLKEHYVITDYFNNRIHQSLCASSYVSMYVAIHWASFSGIKHSSRFPTIHIHIRIYREDVNPWYVYIHYSSGMNLRRDVAILTGANHIIDGMQYTIRCFASFYFHRHLHIARTGIDTISAYHPSLIAVRQRYQFNILVRP